MKERMRLQDFAVRAVSVPGDSIVVAGQDLSRCSVIAELVEQVIAGLLVDCSIPLVQDFGIETEVLLKEKGIH